MSPLSAPQSVDNEKAVFFVGQELPLPLAGNGPAAHALSHGTIKKASQGELVLQLPVPLTTGWLKSNQNPPDANIAISVWIFWLELPVTLPNATMHGVLMTVGVVAAEIRLYTAGLASPTPLGLDLQLSVESL